MVLLLQPLSPSELWHWVHVSYGDELGLTSSDDDYVPPPGMEDMRDHIRTSAAKVRFYNLGHKKSLCGLQPVLTQTGLFSHR